MITTGIEFGVGEIYLETEDLLLAYSDGITDTMNSDNSTFGRQRLEGLVREHTGGCSELLSLLVDQAQQFAGEVEQFDDITLLAVKRKG